MRRLFALLLISSVVAGMIGWRIFRAPITFSSGAGNTVEFVLSPGMSLRAAAAEIRRAGADIVPWQLVWLARLAGSDRQIQAGSYELAAGTTLWQLLEKLTRGDVTHGILTVPEGKTFAEFRRLIDGHPDLRHDSREMDEAELMAAIGAASPTAEGWFFPATYFFPKQSSDIDLYRRAHRAMLERLQIAWQGRAADLPLKSPEELLILASLIEKETGHPADRGLIASVFVNRLKRRMPLQSDPTVIYGLGEKFDGNLRRRDLLTDTRWNTYTRTGLPPTPICLPSQASLAAAANPPTTDYLYFVARGDGTSEFSVTLEAHHRAVAKYQLGKK